MSDSYRKRGGAYEISGNLPLALKDYLNSLKVAEESSYKEGIRASYDGIGRIYEKEGKYTEALKYFIASSKAREATGDSLAIATSYNTLGEIYLRQGDTVVALRKLNDALKIFKNFSNEYSIVISGSNLGQVYFYQGNFNEALKHFFVCLKISETLKDHRLVANQLIDIGKVYEKQKNYGEALVYMKKALTLALATGYKDVITEAYRSLSGHYAELKDFKAAYENEVLFKQAHDSIFNSENEKKLIGMQMQFEFDNKESLEKADQEKKDAITRNEMLRQKLLRNGILFVFAVLLIMAVIIFILVIQYREIRLIKKERTRISRELHDDIGAELTRITVISQQLQKKTSKDAGMLEKLRKISEAGKNVLGTIGEIIWTMNQQKDTLENLVAYIRRFVTEYLEMNDINVIINVPDEIPAKSVSGEYRRNIYLAVKEAISNITKYSKATRVELSVKFSKKQAELEISDNGTGFSLKEKANWGNGLRNMDQRMKEIGGDFQINSEKNLGTLIKLTFPVH